MKISILIILTILFLLVYNENFFIKAVYKINDYFQIYSLEEMKIFEVKKFKNNLENDQTTNKEEILYWVIK
jgi:hypothetical protein